MRLIAVPLARLRPGSQPVSTFLAQRAPVVVVSAKRSAAQGDKDKDDSGIAAGAVDSKKLPLASRLSARASAFWLSLGDPNAKSTLDWKRRTYQLGERIMDRIEYEEWALKGIDPALAPSLAHPTSHQTDTEPDAANPHKEQTNIPLLYPPSLLKPKTLLASLERLTEQRTPHHRKWMWVCLIGAPLTAPFALVPVIPNLPFFYLAWRAWSHWKAYQSSAYLSTLIAQNRLVPTPSQQLDDVYGSKEFAPLEVRPKPVAGASSSSETKDVSSSESSQATSSQSPAATPGPSQAQPPPTSPQAQQGLRPELLLVSQDQIKRIIAALEIDEKLGLATDLRRAMEQTRKLLEKGELGRLELAAQGQSADTGAGGKEGAGQ